MTTSKDYAVTVLHSSEITVGRNRSFHSVTVFTSRCLVAGSNGGHSSFFGFPNCPRPQLPASNSNNSQQLHPSSQRPLPSNGSICHGTILPYTTMKDNWNCNACGWYSGGVGCILPGTPEIVTSSSWIQFLFAGHRRHVAWGTYIIVKWAASLCLPVTLVRSHFPNRIPCAIWYLSEASTFRDHSDLLEQITLTASGQHYRLWSFHANSVICLLCCPNISVFLLTAFQKHVHTQISLHFLICGTSASHS
jgi:hypothetical protein